ncbi:hypothetical protein DL764_005242 [Monosporascus ibericus]|uniref:MalT-like TPR region domain-containing protein n=1 Tax=Monosporascus ibericus TaxID=155417 RepID=A0A4Q4T9P4_9PEZI|nr:hypothetical protein DL764_005242 [Monosporascus ibericus]
MDYFDLGSYRRRVTTPSADAQRAAETDPECCMAYWGILYAIGPNYNKSWPRYDPDDLQKTVKRAHATVQRGREARNAQPVERALIEAIAARFPLVDTILHDLTLLDLAYSKAMRCVYEKFSDIDVALLYVDAVMCFRSLKLWDLDTGKLTGSDVVEAKSILEAGLARPDGRNHPGFCHLYIHMMEMAPSPEKALAIADRLRRLVPDGSHMQHMATHIDIACGDYSRGIESNRDAVILDDKYFSRCEGSTLYRVYRCHNIHVLIYAAMMAGRSEDALKAAKHLQEILTPEFLSIKSPPVVDWAEYQYGMMAHVLIRFGHWEDILQLELPQDQELMSITTAMIRYARGVALSALGRIHETEAAKAEFEAARRAVPEKRQYGIACSVETVLQVPSQILEGELEYRKGNYKSAFVRLRKGILLEDNLPYVDPPVWLQPIRHALGALLLEQGHVEEATEVYKQDLGLSDNLPRRKPRINNVWALHGLHE